MIIKYKDIKESWEEFEEHAFLSMMIFYAKENEFGRSKDAVMIGDNTIEYIFNPEYDLRGDVLSNLAYSDSEWFLLDDVGYPVELPDDLFIPKKKKTLVIENKEITKELIKLGYIYIYLDIGDNIYVTKSEPIKKEKYYHVECNQPRDNLFIGPFASNPHNLKWDESLTKLENLL